MSDQPDKPLIRHSKETYGSDFSRDLIEQYKLYVQSVDNVSARRVSSGRYLLTINAALIASYGFQPVNSGQIFLVVLAAIAGIVISLLSYNIIKSHRDLNALKFKVIVEFEQHLPANPYDYEWQLAEEGKGKAYRSVSQIELWIPIVFLVLHVIALTFVIALNITTLQTTLVAAAAKAS